MKTLTITILTTILLVVLAFAACKETATGPNDLGGDPAVVFTTVGSKFGSYLDAGSYVPGFDRLQDSTVVTKNDNGIVTTHTKLAFDSVFVAALDTALGTSAYPQSVKLAIIDTYLKKYGATIDTADKKKMKVDFDLKLKVTSDGIQEFINGKGDLSRPFTIVKYGAAVGDKYEFTNSEGLKITRTVTSKSTTDDYPIGFWLIKVIQVEQTSDDPLTDKIIFYTNHKFGLVGVLLKLKSGKQLKIGIFPPNL